MWRGSKCLTMRAETTTEVSVDRDNKKTGKVVEKPFKREIIWLNVFLHALLHAGALYGFTIRSEGHTASIIFWKLLYLLSTIGILAGNHRLFSHRSYKANSAYQIMILFFVSLTYEDSSYVWARDHRLHHKFTETDADPYNSKRGFFFCHIGWLMSKKHPDVLEKGKETDLSDLHANKLLMFQHRNKVLCTLLIGVMFSTFVPWYFFGESVKFAFFTGTLYRYITQLHITLTVNSLAHLFGHRPYEKNIAATENLLMKLFGFGEGFHNYHHTFPMDYKTGEFSQDTRNITSFMIDFFAWIGWVTDRQTVKKETVQMKIAAKGDGTYEAEPSGVYKFIVDIPIKQLYNSRNLLFLALYMYLL